MESGGVQLCIERGCKGGCTYTFSFRGNSDEEYCCPIIIIMFNNIITDGSDVYFPPSEKVNIGTFREVCFLELEQK